MNTVSNYYSESDSDFDSDINETVFLRSEIKPHRKSFFRYFISEFNQKFIIKDIINLAFAYGMTKYVIESSNPIVYIAVGVVFLNTQNAVMKYFINK